MWQKASLRVRFYILLVSLLSVTLVGGLVMVWYTYRMQALLTDIIDRNLEAFQTAESLEIALVNQKGFLSYYILDGDPDWLRQLGEHRQVFKEKLGKAYKLIETAYQKRALDQIGSEYLHYITVKDQVISCYIEGNRKKGAEIHKRVRNRFFKILDFCEAYKKLHRERIEELRGISCEQAEKLRIITVTAILLSLVIGLLLTFLLMHYILTPLRKITQEADRKGGADHGGNEMNSLSLSVHDLLADVNDTQSELLKSRETLLQAEKMASVGKLAAGMAHSIRNPLTSVKMRMFSLGRSLQMSSAQKDDFQVISEEIRHIDTIVQNFLEFSRPPKLIMQRINPSDVVEMVLQLLRHRLESYNVSIEVHGERESLPTIEGDPEQLKEVLVNLVENACQAMNGKGGAIVITEEKTHLAPYGLAVRIKLEDNGPGMEPSIREKIFQPFFTTKEEGTGLGLSIASRIVEEHRGELRCMSNPGEGTTFEILIPVNPNVEELNIEQDPDCR